MKNLFILAFLSLFATSAALAGDKPSGDKKAANLAKVVNMEKSAKLIRDGKRFVGKTYGMAEGNRFHNVHDVALGIPCNGCHNVSAYPDDYLFLRKAEFPIQVDGEDVGAVHRAKCLGCHSAGGIATPFYNLTKK